MSKNSVSRGSTNGAVASEVKFAGNDKEKMYEPKHRRKLVRVLTVIAYLFSVSLAAIMLSLFYVFIYNPGKPNGENEQDQLFPQTISHINNYKINQDRLGLINDTYFNMEREEPRALPVKAFNDPTWSQLEWVPEDYQNHYNYSLGSLMENKTILHKILKLLRAD